MNIQDQIEALSVETAPSPNEIKAVVSSLLEYLNAGTIRSAEPVQSSVAGAATEWRVNTWVKQGILLCFKYGKLQEISHGGATFFDKDMVPLKPMTLADGVRLVPGGSAIRTGSYIAPSVICMPPMYINIGSYVDEGTMIDSHALVGTCAQIGKRVHISAAAQIGGVLEPAGARPVIIEDDAFVGGSCGVYEGVMVRRRAVLSSGVILNASSKVYDAVNDVILEATADAPLEIPSGAVVVSGTRPLTSNFGVKHGLAVYTPVIVKYRDEKTDVKTALEDALR
jgi:2,3,4,5-tetrahydropyridine-2,6-dicarboxylate N-succinyltransferase